MPISELKEVDQGHQAKRFRKVKIPWNKLKIVAIITGLVCLGLGLIGVLALTLTMAWISRDLPNPNTLITREIPLSTKIYDRSGNTLLKEIHGEEKRTFIKIEEIPDVMKQATIAIEDRQFYEHHGVNWLRIIKAIYVDVIQRRKAQGASTLTQQLVKNAILTNEKSWERKIKEVLLALQIERRFTKDQILQMYLNEIPYGAMLYGVESASESYFGKTVKDLTLDEAALLAAIPQAPDRYSPYGTGLRGDNRIALVARQHQILDAMAKDKYITQEQADAAQKIDTLKKLVPRKTTGDVNAPHFVDYVKSQLIETYGQKKVEQGGLRVITTLDWDKQQIAQEEITKGVEKNGANFGFTNAALVSLDPKTGQIIAMVGSKDFNDESIDGQVNVTIRPRQPGSSFKPIVYAAGFIKGYTPETTLWDVLTTFKTDSGEYNPKNYSPLYHGPVSVRKALQGSLNIPAVKMLYLVGVGRVLDFAEQLGYTTFGDRARFGLSLVLGGGEVKLLEHANAYASFANRGKQYPVSAILKVTDQDGSTLEEWKQPEGSQAMPQEVADEVANVLSDNGSRAYIFGSKNYLTLPDRAVAAKTGTTNNYKDAWTMGFVPSLAAGVWVGNSSSSSMTSGADGSVVAAPIWQGFMRRALADSPKEQFPAMPALSTTKPVLLGKAMETKLKVDKLTGKLATEYTPPDMVEERSFFEAHNILWYVDKDDPLGPAPTHPENDPQFANWEKSVQEWVQKNQWHTTSTAPTEYDDVHTKDSQPIVTLIEPQANATLNSREGSVNATVQALRTVSRLEVRIDDVLIGEANIPQGTVSYHIPNTVSRGYHDLTLTAVDEMGDRGSAKTTINLMADPAPVKVSISAPSNNSVLPRSGFPVSVTLLINDLQNVQKLDVFFVQNSSVMLLGSIVGPTDPTNILAWSAAPEKGTIEIYPVAYFADGSSLKGESIQVTIE
jgi:1A family penicillin-binding protein